MGIFTGLKVFRICALTLVAASHVGGGAVPNANSDPLSTSLEKRAVYIQICVPDGKAVVEEITVDVTDIPEDLSQQDWQDMLLKAKVTGRYDRPEAAQRAVVTMRAARPAEGPDAVPPRLGMGEVAISRGVGSVGFPTLPLADSTDREQPVYQAITTKQQGELVALNVELHLERRGKKEMTTFWFKPPQRIASGSYTEWLAPVFQEGAREPGTSNRAFFMLDGKDLPTSAVDTRAPRIRYTLMSWEEYTRGGKERMRASRMNVLRAATGASPSVEARRVVKGSIPGC